MKTIKDKLITPQQLKALHTAFRGIGMDEDDRHSCIYAFTSGRTESSKELTMNEARLLISRLKEEDEKKRNMMLAEKRTLMRSIYYLSTQISFLNKDFPSDTEEDRKMNIAKLDVWARKYSRFHKNISCMDVEELREVKKQLEAIARKEQKKENDNKSE